MSQTFDVTLYAETIQTFDVTLWDGQPPTTGYLWYDVDVTAVDGSARPFLAPLDIAAAGAPLDITAALAPLDIRAVYAPLDVTAVFAPLDMESEVP